MEFKVEFFCEAHWDEKGLIIECPSSAARDFIARTIEDEPLVIKLRDKNQQSVLRVKKA